MEGEGHGTAKSRYYMQKKNEIGPLSYVCFTFSETHARSVSKWIKDLNIRPQTINLLGKREKKLIDIDLGNFLDIIPKVQATKALSSESTST